MAEIMVQNVAYRATVYRTGLACQKFVLEARIEEQKKKAKQNPSIIGML